MSTHTGQPEQERGSVFSDIRPTWGKKAVSAQRDAGWFCYGCAKWLTAGTGLVLRTFGEGCFNGQEVTHGLYCSRGCRRFRREWRRKAAKT